MRLVLQCVFDHALAIARSSACVSSPTLRGYPDMAASVLTAAMPGAPALMPRRCLR